MSKARTIGLLAAVIGVLGICGAAFADVGPAAYWRLDEGMGQTAYDWVGGNHGTLIGDTSWLSGIIGAYALEFDGQGDFVRTTYEGGPAQYTVSLWYNLNEDIDCNTFDGFRALLSKTGDETSGVELWNVWFAMWRGLALSNEKTRSNYTDVWYVPEDGIFHAGQWHHVVAMGCSTEGRIYFDGELKSVVNDDFVNGAWNDSVPLDIGRPYLGNADRFFNGKIDDVMIFERVLSDGEVAAIYADGLKGYGYRVGPQTSINMIESVMAEKEAMLAKTQELLNRETEACEVLDEVLARGDYGDLKKGDVVKAKEKTHSAMQHQQQLIDVLGKSIEKLLDALSALGWAPEPVLEPVAWWKFDENKGGIAYDSIADNDGVLTNGPTRVKGVSKKGLEFDGLDDFVLGVSSPFDFENASFTVSGWLSTTVVGGTIISEGAYLNGGWHVAVNGEGGVGVMLKAANTSNAYSAYTTETYNDGQWHHVTVVVTTDTSSSNGNHADVYVDGVQVSVNEAKAYAYSSSNECVTIGARAEGVTTYFAGMLDEVIIFDTPLLSEQIQQLYIAGMD